MKVEKFRELMGLPADASKLHLDAWGMKRLFSHGLRRWNAADFPKVLQFAVVDKLFISLLHV